MAIDAIELDLIKYMLDNFVQKQITQTQEQSQHQRQLLVELRDKLMATNEEFNAGLQRVTTILEKIRTDAQGQAAKLVEQKAKIEEQKVEIEALKAQIVDMGLTKEQEEQLLQSINGIGATAEEIDALVPEEVTVPPVTA
jgi:uncharacterized coiled-coil DUF342 family protein